MCSCRMGCSSYLHLLCYKCTRFAHCDFHFNAKIIINKKAPINKDPQLHSTPINIRFHRTLNHNAFTHTLSLRILALVRIYLLYSLNSYTYSSVKVLCFAGLPSCPLNKGISQSRCVKFGSLLWPRPPWRVLAPYFGKYMCP